MSKILFLCLFFLSGLALAQTEKPDYSNSPLNSWYRSLKIPGTSTSCCDVTDCGPVTSRIANNWYEVLIDDKWHRVPDKAVLQNKENPTGEPVACFKRLDANNIHFYCFIPGFEG